MELTPAHLRCLLAIYEVSQTHLDISSRSIAEKLGVTKPSVVRVLNLLIERFTALALTAALPERVFTGRYDQLMGAEEAPSAAG